MKVLISRVPVTAWSHWRFGATCHGEVQFEYVEVLPAR